jgi:hypothetical protein
MCTGEATDNWAPYLTEISDIGKIPSTYFDVLDTGEPAADKRRHDHSSHAVIMCEIPWMCHLLPQIIYTARQHNILVFLIRTALHSSD